MRSKLARAHTNKLQAIEDRLDAQNARLQGQQTELTRQSENPGSQSFVRSEIREPDITDTEEIQDPEFTTDPEILESMINDDHDNCCSRVEHWRYMFKFRRDRIMKFIKELEEKWRYTINEDGTRIDKGEDACWVNTDKLKHTDHRG